MSKVLSNMNESQKHARQKKLDTKKYKMYDFIYMTFIEDKTICANRNQISGWLGQEVGNGNALKGTGYMTAYIH